MGTEIKEATMGAGEGATRGERPAGLLTRGEAARTLGISKSSFRRREADGRITHAAMKGAVHLFRESDVQRLADRPREVVRLGRAVSRGDTTAFDGRLAARVFECLDGNTHPVDIVKALEAHPDAVEILVARWARMRQTFVVPPDALLRMENAGLLGGTLDSVDALVDAVEETAQAMPNRCARCRKCSASLCQECVRATARPTEKSAVPRGEPSSATRDARPNGKASSGDSDVTARLRQE